MRKTGFGFMAVAGVVLTAATAANAESVTPITEIVRRLEASPPAPIPSAAMRAWLDAEARKRPAKFHSYPVDSELTAASCGRANQRLFKNDLSLILATSMTKEKFSLKVDNSDLSENVSFRLDHVDAEGRTERLAIVVPMKDLRSELETKIRFVGEKIKKAQARLLGTRFRGPLPGERKKTEDAVSVLRAERDLAKADLVFLNGLAKRPSSESLTWAPRVARLMTNACSAKQSAELLASIEKYQRQRPAGESMRFMHRGTEKRFHSPVRSPRDQKVSGKHAGAAG